MTNHKKIFTILILIVLAFALVFSIFYFSKNRKSDSIPKEQEPIETESESAFIEKVYISFPQNENDLDMDGVDDAKEKELGTSNSKVDTDGDGLTDKIEIEKLGTDPTKGDTDGDGYSDASELRNGYDPLGPGKLEN